MRRVANSPDTRYIRCVTSSPTARLSRIAGLVTVVFLAGLYLLTLDDGLRPGELEGGDLITHQYAQVQGRPSNAPGYPLYTMGGWLWFRVGRTLLGAEHNPIQILSSYSTLWALVALALLYSLCLRVTRRNWPVAALATAFLGLTYFFWYYAVTTEQYTSSVAWTLAVLLLAFRWEETRQDDYLLGLALLTGIGLAHQVTVLAILPPVLWFVLRTEPGVIRRGRLIGSALLLMILPLLSYIYIYVRGAQHPEWRGAGQWDSTWAWFLSFVSTGQGRGELTWSLQPFLTPGFPSLIWGEMTWPGLLAGLAGIAALGRRRAALLYATIAIYIVFCLIDRQGNWYQVIMPVYALLALGIAAGADWVMRRSRSRRVTAVVTVLLIALVIYRGAASFGRADASNRPDDTALAPGWAILADDPPPGTAVLGTQPESLSLGYLTEIWGQRSDLRRISSAEARELLDGPGFAVTEAALPLVPTEVDPNARYSALGRTLSWVRLEPITEIPPGLLPWRQAFGDDILLAGGKATRNHATGEEVITLAWQAAGTPDHDWSISVRLVQAGSEITQMDRQHPVSGAYPTTRWLPGEVVADAYPFVLPAGTVPDAVTIVVYRRAADGGFFNVDSATFPLP